MRRFGGILLCFICIVSACGCSVRNKDNPPEQNCTTPKAVYQTDCMLTEKFAVYSEYSNQGEAALHFYDVASGVSTLYCFNPECDHRPSKVDVMTGKSDGNECIAYSLGGRVFNLQDNCGYFLKSKTLVRADRDGNNQKVIADIEEAGGGIKTAELYTSDRCFAEYVFTNERILQVDENGNKQYILGDVLEKKKVAIYQVSLTDGETKEIFASDEWYDINVRNLCEYRDHLYFMCIGLDVPFDSLPDGYSDYDGYVKALQEHSRVRVYDYDIKEETLNLLFYEEGAVGYDFCDGCIVKSSLANEPGVLFDTSGRKLRELPFSVSRLVRSDRYLLAQYYSSSEGNYYYLYNPEEDTILNSVEMKDELLYLVAAVGESYYAYKNSQLCFLKADDFWTGHFENAVELTHNQY